MAEDGFPMGAAEACADKGSCCPDTECVDCLLFYEKSDIEDSRCPRCRHAR